MPPVPATTPHLPLGATSTSLTTSAGALHVLHAGEPRAGRTPVMLVHGGGTDSAAISWFRAMAPLSVDREVWAIDLPGFGGSMHLDPVGGPSALAGVVAEAIQAAGLERAVVIGVSMGGDVALTLALEHPERVAGLVLIAPGGLAARIGRPVTQYAAWLAAQMPDWMLLPLARFANRFVEMALRAIVRDPAVLPPQVVSEFTRLARDPRGGLGYGRYNQATLGPRRMRNDRSGDMHRITVPTLIFHGEDDPMVDPEGSKRAAERMPRARLVLVPDCGHWAQLEAHDRFLIEAKAHLEEIDEVMKGTGNRLAGR